MAFDIVINTYGNEKQKQAARYWHDKDTFDIVYGGSKGCTSSDSLIATINGLVEIKDIKIGDIVLTFNEKTKSEEWKPVLKVKKYLNGGGTQLHKMITFVSNGNKILTLTPNHEVYIEGNWVPAGELARRIMDIRGWNEQSVCNINGREIDISTTEWTQDSLFFEWYEDKGRIFENEYSDGSGGQVGFDSQVSCFKFNCKPRGEATCEPHRFQPIKQQGVELRVGYRQGKCSTLEREVTSAFWEQEGGKKQYDDLNRRASFGDSKEIQKENCHQRNVGRGIQCQSCNNQGCNSPAELDPYLIDELEFSLASGYVYDLQIEDNHNYCVSDERILIHNSGKSYLGCSLIFADALYYPGTQYFIARKTLADLRKFTMASIAEVLGNWGIPESYYHYNGQDNFYLLKNGSKVFFLDCKPMPSDPEYARFGSMQFTRGMIEESGEVEEAAKNNLAASIGRWKNLDYDIPGKLIQTCNPAKNYLYRDYYLPHKMGLLPDWKKFIQALPQDNKKLPPGYLIQLERTLNTNQKKRLLLGNWEYDDDPSTLIDYETACKIFTNGTVSSGARYITSDIARLGGDKIVIIKWDGFRGVVTSDVRQKLDVTTAKIESERRIIGCSKASVLVDTDGLGSGVEDFGGFVGFHNNARALPDPVRRRDSAGKIIMENYDNRKSQCGFRMAERINNMGLFLKCEDEEDEKLILQELEQVKQKEVGTENKKGLVPKEEVRKLLGRSPDFWDAILMREFFELRTRKMRIRHQTGNDVRSVDYFGQRRRYEWEP
jgi:phage terminase large subunit